MWLNPQETADLVTFAEKILTGKLSDRKTSEPSCIRGYFIVGIQIKQKKVKYTFFISN